MCKALHEGEGATQHLVRPRSLFFAEPDTMAHDEEQTHEKVTAVMGWTCPQLEAQTPDSNQSFAPNVLRDFEQMASSLWVLVSVVMELEVGRTCRRNRAWIRTPQSLQSLPSMAVLLPTETVSDLPLCSDLPTSSDSPHSLQMTWLPTAQRKEKSLMGTVSPSHHCICIMLFPSSLMDMEEASFLISILLNLLQSFQPKSRTNKYKLSSVPNSPLVANVFLCSLLKVPERCLHSLSCFLTCQSFFSPLRSSSPPPPSSAAAFTTITRTFVT